MDELEMIKKEKLKKMMNQKLEVEITDGNFEKEVIEKSKTVPVVVDFWAQWCGPCLMLGPVLEKLVKEYKGKFILSKLNVDSNRNTAGKFNIMSIPAVKMFKNGQVADEFVGALPEEAVKEWLDKNLG